jgi:hypothetical protein
MSDNKNKKGLTEEDYIRKHLSEQEDINKNFNDGDVNDGFSYVESNKEANKISDLEYFTQDVNTLPCGKFYQPGTLIKVRAANVKEIQAYSMVDDTNFYDIVEKMDDILQSCIRVKYPDGKIGSFLDIKDQDRLYLIFLIRELTFQQGNTLSVNKKCKCGNELTIELKRQHFIFYQEDENLKEYFDEKTKSYYFKLVNGKEYVLTPPNIGLKKSFTDYILKENAEDRKPNLSFLKIIPFMLPNRTAITYDGIKAKLKEFESMDDVSFQFLNSAVDKMKFGIKELYKICECGEEVHTEMQFPNGASAIFVIHDAFESYIKK